MLKKIAEYTFYMSVITAVTTMFMMAIFNVPL